MNITATKNSLFKLVTERLRSQEMIVPAPAKKEVSFREAGDHTWIMSWRKDPQNIIASLKMEKSGPELTVEVFEYGLSAFLVKVPLSISELRKRGMIGKEA